MESKQPASTTKATPEQFQAIVKTFSPLVEDLQQDQTFPQKRPLLAHYTSIETLERVVRTNELWFSNPLFMDDVEEIRFGINEGNQQFITSAAVRRASGTEERAKILLDAFNYYYLQFADDHVLDLFVLCLSEHTAGNTDGLLSMWRGYGGNGKGVALVIDTAQLTPVPDSPLILSKVVYASTQNRKEWLGQKINQFSASLTSASIPDDQLYIAAWIMFERLKLFSMFSKHHGFSEEREWRIVYLKDRDKDKKLEAMFHYAIGKRGVEPKLKLKLIPIAGSTPPDLSLEKITHQIILGPSASSPLAQAALMRMLDNVGRPALKARVVASNIPFRPVL